MPADIHKLIKDKELILSTIKNRGPCLPVHIARAVNLNMLFASAYLSELFSESRLKMSAMRVGSSPLYYLSGQENLLENFIEHLNPKEREAYLMLKGSKIIDDENASPPIRVALRAIKDFAIPINVKNKDSTKLVWKHFLLNDQELNDIVKKNYSKDEKEEDSPKKEFIQTHKEEQVAPQEQITTPKVEKVIELAIESKPIPQIHQPHSVHTKTLQIKEVEEEINEKPLKKSAKKEKKPKNEDIEFVNKIKEHLESKNFEVLNLAHIKKKECQGLVRIDTPLGKQEYLLMTKDIKKLDEDDVAVAIHKAQALKMPALLLVSGSLDSDAQEYANTWRNLIKIEKTKL